MSTEPSFVEETLKYTLENLRDAIKSDQDAAERSTEIVNKALERIAVYEQRILECEAVLNTIAHDND